MKKTFFHVRKDDLIYMSLVFIAGIVAYLLLINRLGFYGDDWYIIFDAHTQGSAFLKVVYASDRPAVAVLMRAIYPLFGDHLPLYHLSGFGLRFLASLAFYWTLNMVWNKNRFWNFLMSMFLMLYPGFLFQVQPVDYMSQFCSLFLAMFSIALTVKAAQIRSLPARGILILLAAGTCLMYLALVEYYIGLEFLRFFFLGVLLWQKKGQKTARQLILPFLGQLLFAIVPAGFLVWRIFIFQSTRAATDVGLQLGEFTSSPLLVGGRWLVNTILGSFNTIFPAWAVPFYKIVVTGGFRLRDTLMILAAGVFILLVLILVLNWLLKKEDIKVEQNNASWFGLAFWGGLAAAIVAVLPVIITNRSVDFGSSRYTVASSPGAIMMLVAVIGLFRPRWLQLLAVGLLASLSVMTHFGNATNHAYQADSLRDFWWQVSWRAPSIEEGTDLVATYSLMEAPEEYLIWAPANLIYFPEKQNTIPIKVKLPASIPSQDVILNILGGGAGRIHDRRGNWVREDLSAVLVLTQPTIGSCVRILDGEMPELSTQDSYETMLIAPYSHIGNVNWDTTPLNLSTDIFGKEPVHGWCYYYEKAALASQMGDWSTAIALGDEARENGFSPLDPVEWTPFLRAYVATRQMDILQPYGGVMNAVPFIKHQTCQILTQTALETNPDDQELSIFIENTFCSKP
jgi:hypothetical protein